MTSHEAHRIVKQYGTWEPSWKSYLVPLDDGDVAVVSADNIRSDPDLAVLIAMGFVESEFTEPPRVRRAI